MVQLVIYLTVQFNPTAVGKMLINRHIILGKAHRRKRCGGIIECKHRRRIEFAFRSYLEHAAAYRQGQAGRLPESDSPGL